MPSKKPPMRENISSRPTDKYGNRATDADLGIGPGADARRRAAALKITEREGQTNASGARAPVKMPAKIAPAKAAPAKAAPKMPAKQQIIRTTKPFKPTPMTKKR
jgi:hypothetical protein